MVKTVLLLDQYGDIGGGGQRILLDLVQGAPDTEFLVLCPAGPLCDELRVLGAEVHTMHIPNMRDGKKSPLDFFRAYLQGKAVARQHLALARKADLIVVNGMRALPTGQMFQQLIGTPLVLYLHGAYRGIQRTIIRTALKKDNTRAIAPSTVIATAIGMPEKIDVIPNWVSPEFLSMDVNRDKVFDLYQLQSEAPVVLVPGRLSKKKGQLIVLNAYLDHVPQQIELVFTGKVLFEDSGKEVEKRIKRAARMDGSINHRFWEEHSMAHAYDGAQLVIIPSVWNEPFGLAAIEAMSRGIPLIVTNRGELPHLAEGGTYAEVVQPTSKAIALAIRNFLTEPQRWIDRAEKARAHVLKNYHPDTNRKRVYAVWESLVESES